jgi:hypothetical protein
VKNPRIRSQENASRGALPVARDMSSQQAFPRHAKAPNEGWPRGPTGGPRFSGRHPRPGGAGSQRPVRGPRRLSRGVEAVRCRRRPAGSPAGRSREGGSGAFHEARSRFGLLRAAQRGAREGYRRSARARRRRPRSGADDGDIRRRRDAGIGSEGAAVRQGPRPPSRGAEGRSGGCLDCKVRGVAAGRTSPRRFFVSEPSRLPRRQERLREEARCGRLPRPIAPDASLFTIDQARFQ